MPEFLFSNFGQSAISAPLAASDGTILVSPSDALRFPVPGADQVFTLILADGRNEPEIVWVVDNPLTGHLAVQRGREGTPAQAWSVGTSVLHSHTAASLEWFVTGGQILWKNQFQAQLDALAAQVAALQAADETQGGNFFNYQNYVESKFEQSFATISQNWQAVTDFNYALSQITTTLTADVASNHAELQQFQTATAGSFGAQATFNTQLQASTNNANATASQALQATVNLNQALSTSNTTLTAMFGNNTAQITNLSTAQTNLYQALSSQINTVSANYGPLSANVTVQSIALADLTGDVGGAFMVNINTSTGAFSSFSIVAGVNAGQTISYAKFNVSKFIIEGPSGSVNPFVYDAGNGWLSVQNVHVYGDLVVDGSINQRKAVRNSFTNGLQYGANPYTVLNDSPRQYVWSFVFVPVGGRVRVNWQIQTANQDVVKDLDLRYEIDVNTVYQWYHNAKLATNYVHTVFFSQTIYCNPGVPISVVLYGRTETSAGGTLNATVVQILADVDDFGTEN